VALAAQALARGLGCPWVFEVRDLWPASIRAVGVSRGRLLGWIERYELSLYRQAAAVIVLTKPFKDDIVRRGTPAEKVHVVTNGADISGFADLPAKEAARRALRLPQAAFIVGFVGTVGLSQGAATFVKAAKHLSERQDVRFVCWGEGADRRHIEAMAGNLGLKNIEFRDFVPHSQIPTVLASVDAATVLLKRDILFETVIPSKIFEIFAASRPIAACVKGEARAIIEESGGGLCADPEDDEGLAKILVRYADDPAGAERMGRSGAAFVAAHYTRDTLAQKALEIVLRAAAPRAGL
jgi:glycosyltransferase involved in cell wall biosynthesis